MELKNYNDKVSYEKQKFKYCYLSPKNVLFDQYSLAPKLRFEPLLAQAVGLRKRPMSVQMLLSMFPTPEGFDYFVSLPELDLQTVLKLQDSFYGCLQIYGQEKSRLIRGLRESIEREKEELQAIEEEVLFWRFLLTCYYLINGRVYGKQSPVLGLDKLRQNFIHNLSQKK